MIELLIEIFVQAAIIDWYIEGVVSSPRFYKRVAKFYALNSEFSVPSSH